MSDSFVIDGSPIVLPSRGWRLSGKMPYAYSRPIAAVQSIWQRRAIMSFNVDHGEAEHE